MADIISFDNKRQIAEDQKKDVVKKRKVQAVRQMIHCTHCATKCVKCGTQIGSESSQAQTPKLRVPYRFCEVCSEEYLDYIDRLKGKGNRESYWHNDIWMEAWRKWIDYQGLMDRYVQSKEFLQLIDELRPKTPES
jgi:hypothetical protein